MRDALKYFAYKAGTPRGRWFPFLSVFYLTYACDFRCFYCSDGSGRPYHNLETPDSPAETVRLILRAIRRFSNHIVITGGEPTKYRDLPSVLEEMRSLSFKTSVFTTNGYEIERHIDALASSVTDIVISIDSVDRDSANKIYSCAGDRFSKVMENIIRAKERIKRPSRITISSVACADTVGGLIDVYEFARENGFSYAAAPRLAGVIPERGLADNETYRRFYNHLIAEKKKGRRIFGSVKYLEHMRDLREFACQPFTILSVGPDGGVFYPCLEIGYIAGNILDADSLHDLRSAGLSAFGPVPRCGNQCHSACALGFGIGI